LLFLADDEKYDENKTSVKNLLFLADDENYNQNISGQTMWKIHIRNEDNSRFIVIQTEEDLLCIKYKLLCIKYSKCVMNHTPRD